MKPPMLKIYSKKEKAEILKKLNQQFGIKEIPGTILKTGSDRLFLYQGSLTENEIYDFEQEIPIERIGVYFAKIVQGEDAMRLSIEGINLLKEQITKNIFQLTKEQYEQFIKGNEINISFEKEQQGFKIIQYHDDFIGTGKASENKLSNFIPKNRRIREKEN